MKHRTASQLLALLAAMLLIWPLVGARPADAQDETCFPETGLCIIGRFRTYWDQNGGLGVFGFPISQGADETNRDTGKAHLTQWFERNRFEYHPENRPPYDILLGRLGVDRLQAQGRPWQSFPTAPRSAAHYFPQTGHAITHEPFWHYWSTHGLELNDRRGTSSEESLALFGYPISEPARETNASGDTVLTQWFERARFEDHGAKGVLLGLLGVGDTGTCAGVSRIAPGSAEGVTIGKALLAAISAKYPEARQSGPVQFDRIRAIDRAGDWILFNASFKRGLEPAIFVLQATRGGYRLVDGGWSGAPGSLTAADIRAAIARGVPQAPPELIACGSLEGFV